MTPKREFGSKNLKWEMGAVLAIDTISSRLAK
jgi:hypothetical protein